MPEAILPTYKAILRGDRLEWRGSSHQHPPTDRPIAVHVTLLDEPSNETGVHENGQGERMAAALERLAKLRALAEIDDPAAWERATRQERALPGRLPSFAVESNPC
jgi:hypothetical protein